MTKPKLKVALIQMSVGPDRADNLRRARALIAKAARRGAAIACLPELFGSSEVLLRPQALAEGRGGPTLAMLQETAREHRLFLVGGSILERRGRGRPLNTCFFIGPNGALLARYSKMHLFDIHIPGKIRFEESKAMRPGNSAAIAPTPFGRVGFAICNDLRYPELFRRQVLAGARLIFVPSAFTKFTGRDHWVALCRVRAIENQCFVAAVNQSGTSAGGVRFFGSSLLVDPWGRILAEAPARDDAILVREIDLALADRLRQQLPALKKVRGKIPLKIN